MKGGGYIDYGQGSMETSPKPEERVDFCEEFRNLKPIEDQQLRKKLVYENQVGIQIALTQATTF